MYRFHENRILPFQHVLRLVIFKLLIKTNTNMKFLKRIAILLPIIAMGFVSCKKDETIDIDSMENNYTFTDAKWELISKNIEQDGQIGNLYVNANNPIETMFEVKSSKTNGTIFTGTYAKHFENGAMVQTCSGAAKNCRITISTNQAGNVIGVKIEIKND